MSEEFEKGMDTSFPLLAGTAYLETKSEHKACKVVFRC